MFAQHVKIVVHNVITNRHNNGVSSLLKTVPAFHTDGCSNQGRYDMNPYCLRTKRDYKFEIKHVPILSEDKQKLNFEIIDVPIKSGDTQINMANVPTASLPYI